MDDIKKNIKQWDEIFPTFKRNRKTIIEPFTMLVIAPRFGGKSSLIRHIYEQILYKYFDIVIVFTKTLVNEWYQQFVPGKTKFEQYDPLYIEHLFKVQKQRKQAAKPPLNILIIMDDIADKASVLYDHYINELFTRGRHWYISLIFASQDITMINMTWRKNITHAFALKLLGPDLEKLIENFLDTLLSDDEVPEKMKRITYIKKITSFVFSEAHRALVIIPKKDGANFFDYVFFYKAKYKNSWSIRFW